MRPISLQSHGVEAKQALRRLQWAWRAFQRQFPLVLGVAAFTWLIGGFLMALNGASAEGVGVWATFGLAIGGFVGVAHEVERGVIHNLESVERASRRRVTSAAPMISARAMRGLSPDMRSPLGVAIQQPASAYASALRHFLLTLGDAQVVAVLGSSPRDGATATASAVAALASQQGRNVLLVDCDLRRRGVTQLLDSDPEAGVLEAAADPAIWASLIEQEPETGLHIMPAARLTNVWRRLFDQPRLGELIALWRARYDLIVLDCPPSSAGAEGAMLIRLADRCALVASWDETPGADLRQTMRHLRQNAPPLVNLHLNRAPADILDRVRASV